ncbi:MAG: hypothetical protein LJE57_10195 [Gallionella sp.]|nr:hypothetical protein [Gallionella sp.]
MPGFIAPGAPHSLEPLFDMGLNHIHHDNQENKSGRLNLPEEKVIFRQSKHLETLKK